MSGHRQHHRHNSEPSILTIRHIHIFSVVPWFSSSLVGMEILILIPLIHRVFNEFRRESVITKFIRKLRMIQFSMTKIVQKVYLHGVGMSTVNPGESGPWVFNTNGWLVLDSDKSILTTRSGTSMN